MRQEISHTFTTCMFPQVSPEVDASSEVAEPLLREQSDPPPFILSIADEASVSLGTENPDFTYLSHNCCFLDAES